MNTLKISKITPLGKEQVYNLEMEGNQHNYVLENGLISKNSHSCAYGMLAYRTAWLKVHFPVEFCAATLTSTFNSTKTYENLVRAIDDARSLGIRVRKPDINLSYLEFRTIDDQTISFGLSLTKNLGMEEIKEIIKVRENRGDFKSLIDFLQKVDLSIVNKRTVEALIKCGAFDEIETRDKRILIESLAPWVISYKKLANDKVQKRKQKGLLELVKAISSPKNEQTLEKEIADKIPEDQRKSLSVKDLVFKEFEEQTEEEFFDNKPLKPMIQTSFIDNLLMQIESMNFSFNRINSSEIEEQYKVSSFGETSKRNILVKLIDAGFEIGKDGKGNCWKIRSNIKKAKEKDGLILETLTTSEFKKYDISGPIQNYIAVLYGIITIIESKTSKRGNQYYLMTITDGVVSLEFMYFGSRVAEMMAKIQKKDKVVVLMSKSRDKREDDLVDSEEKPEQYMALSILKIKE